MTKNHQAERDVGRPVADRPRCLAPADQVQWRRFLMPRRYERLRQAGMWSVGDLVDDIDERSMPLGDRSPAMARWNDEFFAALMNGFFGHGRRTRVLLLDPKEPVQRLTAERAQQIVEAHGKSGFAGIVPFACIRIDDAHDWLNTGLDDWFIERWLSAPATTDALRAVRQMQHSRP